MKVETVEMMGVGGQVNTLEVQSTGLCRTGAEGDKKMQNDPKSLQTQVFLVEGFIRSHMRQAGLPSVESRGTSETLGPKLC